MQNCWSGTRGATGNAKNIPVAASNTTSPAIMVASRAHLEG
ncbi:hypothetical protein [Acidithrix ferrooxidans]|nr:hypothetical protein [Acidithrix ferrooxidans]